MTGDTGNEMPEAYLNGLIPTLNFTGFMVNFLDDYAREFVTLAGKTGATVLDMGCAYGVAAIAALKAGAQVVACDLEQRHLDILSGRIDDRLAARLACVEGKLPQIDFQPESFDAILCSRVLHFLQGSEIDLAAGKMFRWLKTGGRLILVTDTPYGIWRNAVPEFERNRGNGARWPGAIRDLSIFLPESAAGKPAKGPAFMNLLDVELLERICTEAGLTVLRSGFIDRSDLTGIGRMDGRENAGIVAVKPG